MLEIFRKLKSKFTNYLPPKSYWFIAGKLDPYSAAIEGEKNKENFYKLGDYELKLFKKIGAIQDGYATLEIGCGPGRIQKTLADSNMKLKVFGTDISASMISLAKKNVKNAQFTANNGKDLKQYKNNQFDLVYSFVVFQHIDESIFNAYLKEIYRVLKKDGHLVFQIQSSEGLTNYIRPNKHPWHLRRYSREEIFNKLKTNRFINIKIFDMLGRINPVKVDDSGFLFYATKI